MSVIDMAQWREGRSDDQVRCPCGSAWFELVDGAVTLNAERSIVGYAGVPRCIECGQHT